MNCDKKDEILVGEVVSLVKDVKANLYSLVQEWKQFQQETDCVGATHSVDCSNTLIPAPLNSPINPLHLISPVQPPPLTPPILPPLSPPTQSLPLESPIQLSSNTPPSCTPISKVPPTTKAVPPLPPLVQFPRSDLDRLATEALMLKELLPTVLNGYYISCVNKYPTMESQLGEVRRERDGVKEECRRIHRQHDMLMEDYEQEMKEKFAIKSELQELQEMLTQQADYCSSMGSACCMLLWRVSRHEECIQSILSGSKVGEFLQLASSTLHSFLEAYRDSAPPSETHPEAQFVLALCGTITNIAASTYGRDFLCNCEDGTRLIDTLCSVLGTTPPGQEYSKLRSLILMSLYNISISQRGIKYLISKPKLLPLLVWLIREERDSENRLHILKLIQSAVLEPGGPGFVHRALEAIPIQLLQHLSTDINPEIQDVATELLGDLASLRRLMNTSSH